MKINQIFASPNWIFQRLNDYHSDELFVQGLVQSISSDGREISYEQLKKFYFSPYRLYDVGQLSSLVRGQVSQSAAAVDSYFTKQVGIYRYLLRIRLKNITIESCK